MKILVILSAVLFLTSCSSLYQKELEKTGQANSASQRINSTNSNSDNLFKELGE